LAKEQAWDAAPRFYASEWKNSHVEDQQRLTIDTAYLCSSRLVNGCSMERKTLAATVNPLKWCGRTSEHTPRRGDGLLL